MDPTTTKQNERLLMLLTVLVFMFAVTFAIGGGFKLGYRSAQGNLINNDDGIQDLASIAAKKINVSRVEGRTIYGKNINADSEDSFTVSDQTAINVVDYTMNQETGEFRSGSLVDIQVGFLVDVYPKKDASNQMVAERVTVYKTN